jgi:hypothetical protein
VRRAGESMPEAWRRRGQIAPANILCYFVRRPSQTCASASFRGNGCNLLGDAVLHRLDSDSIYFLMHKRKTVSATSTTNVAPPLTRSRNCNRTVGLKFLSPAKEVLHNKQQSAVSAMIRLVSLEIRWSGNRPWLQSMALKKGCAFAR